MYHAAASIKFYIANSWPAVVKIVVYFSQLISFSLLDDIIMS